MTFDQALVIVGIIIAALAAYLPLRYSMHKDESERAEKQAAATRQAVIDATAPLAADRDYWRTRADEFEKELRDRTGRRPSP